MATLVYRNNPRLRAPETEMGLTAEQLLDFERCCTDPIYFIETYCTIVTLDGGKEKVKLREYQKKMILTLHNEKYMIACIGRQSGKSTSLSLYTVWCLLFNDDYEILIAAHKASAAKEFIKRIKIAYENVPLWLQQGVTAWNKGSIELENGSKVEATATTADAGRSGSKNLVLLDEFAFVETNVADEFYTAMYPVISAGKTSKLAIISTPNGMNHFHKHWVDAEKGLSGFTPISIDWRDVPGRDENFKKETIAKYNGDVNKWMQEFEATFLGSSATLLDGATLAKLTHITPIQEISNVKIFEYPLKGASYFMTVDTSRGRNLDYSAFVIFDITELPYKVVATFRDNNISSLLYPSKIFEFAKLYNDATVLVEVNDNGQEVANTLYYELEYENQLFGSSGRNAEIGEGTGAEPGIRTTKSVKYQGCSSMKSLLEQDQLIINDHQILFELSNFVLKGKSYEAAPGLHDDMVMCLVLFAWAVRQQYFMEITDVNVRDRLYKEQMKQIEEEVILFHGFDDGIKEDEEEHIFF